MSRLLSTLLIFIFSLFIFSVPTYAHHTLQHSQQSFELTKLTLSLGGLIFIGAVIFVTRKNTEKEGN